MSLKMVRHIKFWVINLKVYYFYFLMIILARVKCQIAYSWRLPSTNRPLKAASKIYHRQKKVKINHLLILAGLSMELQMGVLDR